MVGPTERITAIVRLEDGLSHIVSGTLGFTDPSFTQSVIRLDRSTAERLTKQDFFVVVEALRNRWRRRASLRK